MGPELAGSQGLRPGETTVKRLIVLLGVVGVSLSAVFVRLSTAPSMILALYRVVLATLLLTPWVLWRYRQELRRMTRREILLCLISGVCLGLHFVTYFASLRRTSIAASTVLVNTEALFVTLGAVVFLKRKLSGWAWAAVLVSFCGSVIVGTADLGDGGALLGNLLALAGAVLGAAYTLVGTRCRAGGISTTVYTYFVYLASSLTVLTAALISGTPLSGYPPVNLLTALGLAVCCTLLGHSVFSWGLKYLQPSFVATVKLLEPVFAAVWGMLLFREIPGVQVVLGGTVVLVGIALYSRTEKPKED